MKLEYQFTFKEYLEACRISTKLKTFSEVEFWTRAVLIVGGGIVYIIAGPNPVWGYFIIGFGIFYIPIVKFLERRKIVSFDKGFFWFCFSWILNLRSKGRFHCSLFCESGQIYNLFIGSLNFLESFNSGRWIDRANFGHELVSLQVTESGRELETAKVNIKVKWEFYSHLLETENLFAI